MGIRGAVCVLTASVLIGLSVAGGSASAGGPPPLGGVSSWAFAIGNRTLSGSDAAVGSRLGRFDLAVVDGEEATPGQIERIQSHGTVVLGYLSVGTIEKWRRWYPQLKRYRLRAWQDWKDEWFADTSKPGFRTKIAQIADGLLDKGFDGLFLDNVDMVENRGHLHQRRGMGKLVNSLDGLTHDRGLYLFDQNGAGGMLHGYPGQGVDPLYAHFDGWNREDASWTWDFDRHRYKPVRGHTAIQELEDIGAKGLLTTATDYVDLGDHDLGPECDSVDAAAGAGALDYVADIGLTLKAVDANPPACGG
jgi:hypothetical protein